MCQKKEDKDKGLGNITKSNVVRSANSQSRLLNDFLIKLDDNVSALKRWLVEIKHQGKTIGVYGMGHFALNTIHSRY